jgi:hypothetical protein
MRKYANVPMGNTAVAVQVVLVVSSIRGLYLSASLYSAQQNRVNLSADKLMIELSLKKRSQIPVAIDI